MRYHALMGLARRSALWLSFLCALVSGAGCLSLLDATSDAPPAPAHDAGKHNLDGAAGWPGVSCDGGLEGCAGKCVDLTSNPNNCGACGTVCTAPTATCLAGKCTGCPAGQEMCAGTCLDTTSDPNNCGTCGTVCTAPTATCITGTCQCNLDAICDGKCVSLTSNKSNCGSCGNKCPSGYGCHGGQCCLGC